ncbi:MAG: response regulator [Sphingomonadales bacterium]|nr:MAG: response regulator [Sphingomonadales bacterium]
MAHILIADDDELIAELASEVLIDAGHACGWVTGAAAAWRCVQRKRPDLLLLDQGMPGESGLTLLRRLRRSPQLYDLPVMMFTTMRGEQDQRQAIYAGAQDFLSKPFDPLDLVARVSRLIRLRSGRPRHVDLRYAVAGDRVYAPLNPATCRRVL